MNKFVTGGIAIAAGTVLLLGGGGTFALWNATTTVNASSISSGTLALTAPTAGVWTNTTNAPASTIDPATFKIVPGNTLQFAQTLTINATGDDLSANLTYNASTLTSTITGLTSSLAVTSTSSNVTMSGTTLTVRNGAAPATVNVVITVNFPAASTSGQNSTASFNLLTFTLQQVTPVKP